MTAAVVAYKTPTGQQRRGVTTGWFQDIHKQQSYQRLPMHIFVRRSNFKLPRDASTPVILIGPGTGLAPFRGFLQERHFHHTRVKTDNGPSSTVGTSVLFFGCRREKHDYLYREELEMYRYSGSLHHLFVAFSRDTEVS